MLCVMLIMMLFSFCINFFAVQDRRLEFWDISSADVANTTCLQLFQVRRLRRAPRRYLVASRVVGWAVSALAYCSASVLNKCFCILLAAVLSCAAEEQGLLLQPIRRVLFVVLGVWTIFLVLGQTGTIYFFDLF